MKKKVLSCCLAVLMLLSVGCGDSSSEKTSTKKTTTTTTMATTTTQEATTTTTASSESSVPESSSLSEDKALFLENVKKAMNGAKAKVKAFDFDESKLGQPSYNLEAECIITQQNKKTTMNCVFNNDKSGALSSMTVRYKDAMEWFSEYYTDKECSTIKTDSEIKSINEKNIKKFITAAAAMDSENYSDKLIERFASEFSQNKEIKYKNYIYTLSYSQNFVFAILVTRLDYYNDSMDLANKPHFNGYEFAG